MDQPAKFWDKIAERYSKRPVANEAAYQKKLQVTREYFQPDIEVLEFGCGTGSTAITHAPYVKHILAIDISSKMIEIAQGKAEAKNVQNVTFKRSTIDEFSESDQGFDAVLGLSILHLLDNKDEVIAKVYKMLKPGGMFALDPLSAAEEQASAMVLVVRFSSILVVSSVGAFALWRSGIALDQLRLAKGDSVGSS